MATFRSNNYQGRQLRLEVWQSGEDVNWQLFCEGGSSSYYTIYNLSIRINGADVYSPGTVSQSTHRFPAAKGSVQGNINVGKSASNRNIDVSFIGSVYQNRSTQNGGTINIGPTIWPPELSNISYSSVGDRSVYASFGIKNDNGQAPNDPYIDVAENNFSNVVKYIRSRSGTLDGLTPNKTYYLRGNDANSAGKSYTNVVSFKTQFIDPGNPGKPYLSWDQSELISKARITASWSQAGGGSTPIAGYRIRLFRNNNQVFITDTDNTLTNFTFNSLESFGFVPGDIVKVGIFCYCRDWQGTKFFNGSGSEYSQIYSSEYTVVSDKFIYVSVNGSEFKKHKMYISVNGGEFRELKKEKFKVIK